MPPPLGSPQPRQGEQLDEQRTPPAVRSAAARLHVGDLILSFSLPNFHFHVVTDYDILRSPGVPLGQRDYEEEPRTRSA